MPDKTVVSDSLGALSTGNNDVEFGLPHINFDSMNQGLRDILGVKTGADPLFEGYKSGAISQFDFDRELTTRLESVVEHDVGPGRFARGDFSLPKAYTAEMLSVVSAYTGVPLEAFFGEATDGNILEDLLEQQRIEKERKTAADEARRLAEEEERRRQQRLAEEAAMAEEAERQRIADEAERLRLAEEKERERLAVERRRLEEAERRRLEEEAEAERIRLEEAERIRLEEAERLRLAEEAAEAERLRLAEEEAARLAAQVSLMEEEMPGDTLNEESFSIDEDGLVAGEQTPEFVSSLPDDDIQDMDISTEMYHGLKTDVYSLGALVTNRDKGKI